jgi:hypothetical protein
MTEVSTLFDEPKTGLRANTLIPLKSAIMKTYMMRKDLTIALP